MCVCMYLFIDLGDTNSVSSHFWGQFLRSFSFLPLFLYLLEKEMIPAYRKLKRSVMDVRRSLASYSNNINSSWPRLLQKHNVSCQFSCIFDRMWNVCNVLLSNSENCQHQKISGMLIVKEPITLKFRTRKQTSKPQPNQYHSCVQFSFLTPYWLYIAAQ